MRNNEGSQRAELSASYFPTLANIARERGTHSVVEYRLKILRSFEHSHSSKTAMSGALGHNGKRPSSGELIGNLRVLTCHIPPVALLAPTHT
jgi:hypothetical protein